MSSLEQEPHPGYMGPVAEHEQMVVYDPRLPAKLGSKALEMAAGREIQPLNTEVVDGIIVPDAESGTDVVPVQPIQEADAGEVDQQATAELDDDDHKADRDRLLDYPDTKKETKTTSRWFAQAIKLQGEYQEKIEMGGFHGTSSEKFLNDKEKFINILTKPEVQALADKLWLTEAGFLLISEGLTSKDGGPSIKELAGLKRIVDSQWKGTGPEAVEKARSTPEGRIQYRTKFADRVGPFDSEQDDKVAETYKKLNPDFWRLPADRRKYYESVAALGSMTSSLPTYKETPHRYGQGEKNPYNLLVVKPLRKMNQGRRARKLDKENAEKTQPSVADIALTKQIIARWQRRPVEYVQPMSGGGAAQEKILEVAKREALIFLKRDEQLKFLKTEQEIGDEESIANIAGGVKNMSHSMVPADPPAMPAAEMQYQLAYADYQYNVARIHSEAAEKRRTELENADPDDVDEINKRIRDDKEKSLKPHRDKFAGLRQAREEDQRRATYTTYS